ncbi:MAG: LPS export ABC transporter periplasmic protein LptC [Melioribacteraceae bacterium]|jgi:LPS export ABC transporter protein LptC|nr:LPS export ABC transporter periplasmic protein LptC [Melioribacteraceae bacterium]
MSKFLQNYIMGFIITLLLISCNDEKIKPQVDLTMEEENLPIQESWNSKILFTENGKLKGILYTDYLETYKKPKEKLLKNVKVEFYNDTGVKTSQLTSKRGKIDDATQDMYAIDSVVATNDSAKVKLESDELMWRKKDEKIVSDKFVRITTETEVIEGYGLVSDQNIENYVIKNVTYQTTTSSAKK